MGARAIQCAAQWRAGKMAVGGQGPVFSRVRRPYGSSALTLCLLVTVGCSNMSANNEPAVTEAAALTGDASLRMVRELPAPQTVTEASEARIVANDLLQIDVFQVQDLSREVRVGGDGDISLPLIGKVAAAGRTAGELEHALEATYGATYLNSPEISVVQKESIGSRITMDGQFTRTGLYPSGAQSTLLQMVAQAGGLTGIGDDQRVYVYRQAASGRQVASFSISAIRAGKRADPRLYGGDVVVAFASGSKVALQNLKEALGLASSASRLAIL